MGRIIHTLNSSMQSTHTHTHSLSLSLLSDVLPEHPSSLYPLDLCTLYRHLVFRPFEGEILEGKVLSSSSEGVRITLGFFDNIYIPAHLLQDPSELYVLSLSPSLSVSLSLSLSSRSYHDHHCVQ
eukprot:TRINITY_DN184_c1_g1_i16.p2 TRINITY_DN184_c1_g1~~TRINITY_DN184_c1_g1_i16.p2  ORF type:complete len:125 (-),score=9.41 TRINITY_DN184_c1_g1_i16:317-691(-)